MNPRSIVKNVATAFLAQGISLFVSLIMSLLVPKVMGVTAYGYWQLFIFYVTYSGFFHFGLVDGVYLLEGGKSRKEIDKKALNSQFRFAVIIQTLVSFCIILVAILSNQCNERAFVLIAFAAYSFVFDLSAYFGYLFQAMNETKLFSFMTILDRVAFLVPMVLFLVVRINSFEPYVVAYFIAKFLVLLYAAWNGRDVLAAGTYPIRQSFLITLRSIKVGFCLMIANIADMLILGVGRFFIDSNWGVEVFGKVSFSLSLVNFFITFVSQVAMVLFPALRRGSKEEQKLVYAEIRNTLEIVFPAIYCLYFPLVVVLSWWLPQYEESMIYFAFLLPVCIFNTKMSLCCSTYFKVLRMEKELLKINIITVVVSLLFTLVGVYICSMVEFVLLGAVVAIIARSLWSEHRMNKCLMVPGTYLPYEELILTLCFLLCVFFIGGLYGCILYTVIYIVYLALNRNETKHVLQLIKAIPLALK